MNDAFKILGTLVVAGFLTLALTNTTVGQVTQSAQQNLALSNSNNSVAFANTNNDIVFRQTANEDNIIMDNTDNNDNQRVINGSNAMLVQANVANNLGNSQVYDNAVVYQGNSGIQKVRASEYTGTASVASSNGVVLGNGFRVALVFLIILVAVGIIYRVMIRRRYVHNGYSYGYQPQPAYAPRYYDVPRGGYNTYPVDQYNGYNQDPVNQTRPMYNENIQGQKVSHSDSPEYRMNLG